MATLTETSQFHIYHTGPFTVIGFDGRDLNSPETGEQIRENLLELIDDSRCQILVVDMREVDIIGSWILGLFAALRARGVCVELYHPMPEIRRILQTTHLDQMLHVRGLCAG